MRLFRRKKISLPEVIDGLLCALDDARERQQTLHEQALERFTDAENSEPVTKKLKIGARDIEVPMLSLIPRNTMEIGQVNFMFRMRISDIVTRAVVKTQTPGKSPTYPDLEIDLDKIEGDDDDTVMVSICLRTKEIPADPTNHVNTSREAHQTSTTVTSIPRSRSRSR